MREFIIILFIAAGMFFYGYLMGRDIQRKKFEEHTLRFNSRAEAEAFLKKVFEEIEKEDNGE